MPILDALSCALFPSQCLFCESSLPRLSRAPVCDACWAEMPQRQGDYCTMCGDHLRVQDVLNSYGCRRCRVSPPDFDRVLAWGHYDGRLREAIRAFKFDKYTALARPLGQRLAAAIAQHQLPANMLMVPVPMFRTKQRQRGFNQAELLADVAMRALHHCGRRGFTLSRSALLRTKDTQSQSELNPRERRANLRGAFFVCDEQQVRGRHILLVDDILTTGATAREASAMLMAAGAESVTVAALARTFFLTAFAEKQGSLARN